MQLSVNVLIMPSTNLSTGLSTKPTRLVPDYLSKTQNYVPLSVFFMGVPEQEANPDSLFGFRMPEKEKKEPSDRQKKKASSGSTSDKDQKQKDDKDDKDKEGKTQKTPDSPQRSQTSKPRPQASVPSQGAQGGNQEAPKQERLSLALGKLLDIVQDWKPIASSESMTTTANVSTLPVPIGAGDGRKFLDSPGDDKRKRKRKNKHLSRKLYLLLRQ